MEGLQNEINDLKLQNATLKKAILANKLNVLNEEHEFKDKYSPKPEDKTTGQIIFESLNRYDYDYDFYLEGGLHQVIDTRLFLADYQNN